MRIEGPKISITGEVLVKVCPKMEAVVGDHELETTPVTVCGRIGFSTSTSDPEKFGEAMHTGILQAFKRAVIEAMKNLKEDAGSWRCKTHDKEITEEMKHIVKEGADFNLDFLKLKVEL